MRQTRLPISPDEYHKRLVLGEAWLYKSHDADFVGLPVAAARGLCARDVFSFWEQLDVEVPDSELETLTLFEDRVDDVLLDALLFLAYSIQ